jgi:phosphonoacetate hydrolase
MWIMKINERNYRWPKTPVAVCCIDGCAVNYIEAAVASGLAPNLQQFMAKGQNFLAKSVIPSITNPNNLSIITGVPPKIHGISSNLYLNRETGETVMMDRPEDLRAETILAAFQRAGATVAAITAKDKLRRMLGKGLLFDGTAFCFSSETADHVSLIEHGIENLLERLGRRLPDVYSAELTEVALAAAIMLANEERPDLMYISTTDYIQHKYPPESQISLRFYRMLDNYLGTLDSLGYSLAITADHGMNAKHNSDGKPNILYLQSYLDSLPEGREAQVILPITDPYVIHHGALGSYAMVYLKRHETMGFLQQKISRLDHVAHVYERSEAAERFDLPVATLGDLIVICEDHYTLGTREEEHELGGLTEPLRSHGGFGEQDVPLIFNKPVNAGILEGPTLHNYDAFYLLLN